VNLTANGARVSTLQPGQTRFAGQVRLSGSSLAFGIETEGFAASSRTLGTRFVSLKVTPAPLPEGRLADVPLRLWLGLASVLLVSLAVHRFLALDLRLILLPPALFLAMVFPAGLFRSAWLPECAFLVSVAAVLSAMVARPSRGGPIARAGLQGAMILALTVHGLLPPSPLVIQGDAQLHGNKLAEVARGNRFPISRSDHKKPFEFPYGFSFYGILSPLVSTGVSNVRIVREGAAFFWALSILALAFLLGRRSATLAAAAVTLWTFAPVNIRTMGFGNLNNVFAQAIFVLFLTGASLGPRGKPRGLALAFLVALSATAHLSSFIVLFTLLLLTFAIPSDRRGTAFKPLLLGVAAAAAYFATFVPMIVAQAPRLLSERGGSAGVFDPWHLPRQIVSGAGWPLIGLIGLALLVRSVPGILPASKSLALTGLVLAVAALVSPIEVRYLLAVMPLLAVAGASMFDDQDLGSFPRQNLSAVVDLAALRTLGREAVSLPLAFGLLLASLVHGARVLLEFLPLSGA
jgi:hypothetical protein